MLKFVQVVFLALFCFIKATFAVDTVAVPSVEARHWMNTKGHELLTVLGEKDKTVKYAKLDTMMREDVNLDYIAKFVIGKYARLMDSEQKARYHDLFRRYVLSLYKKADFDFDASAINFSIDSVTEYPRFTTVSCTIDPSKISKDVKIEKIPVKFKLIRGPEDRIQAVDVDISDVSMVIEYRKRFYQIILDEDENMDWFLDKLYDRVKANEESGIQKPVILNQ